MPIIKDKYKAKGVSPRSKFVTRKFNQAIQSDAIPQDVLTTEQKQTQISSVVRAASAPVTAATAAIAGTVAGAAISAPVVKSNITGVKLSANTVQNIFTLSKDTELMDIIISHWQVEGVRSVISMYWSTFPIEDLTFTVSTGVITAVTGGTIYRILSDTFTSSSTLSIRDSGIYTFSNLNKDIHFYAVCSVVGPEITIIKT
jgi:hypothetical protein